MSFLTLNGIVIPVAEDSVGRALREIGERARSFSGASRVSRQTTKQQITFTTPLLPPANVEAFVGLIQGEGHVWSFDSADGLYSSKGTYPSSTLGTVAAGSTVSTPKFAQALSLSGSSVASRIVYTVDNPGSDWTVAFWRSEDDGTTWHHHIVSSSGNKFLDGVLDVTATPFLTMGTTTIQLDETTADPVFYDDLVFFPFEVIESGADAWITSMASASEAWPAVPLLVAEGDAIPVGGSLSMHGSVQDVKLAQGSYGGVWCLSLGAITFTLEQI